MDAAVRLTSVDRAVLLVVAGAGGETAQRIQGMQGSHLGSAGVLSAGIQVVQVQGRVDGSAGRGQGLGAEIPVLAGGIVVAVRRIDVPAPVIEALASEGQRYAPVQSLIQVQ